MIDEILENLAEENAASIESLKSELSKVRTGRAHVGILDSVRVPYYGNMSPLNQVASVSVPDPRQITIKPWDKTLISAIEKAILQAELGLNPSNDGEIVRLVIPPLTTERRQELVKMVRRTGEDTKVAVRNHRRDANALIKEGEKDGAIPEDDAHKGLQKVQERTDACVKQIDQILEAKEREILED